FVVCYDNGMWKKTGSISVVSVVVGIDHVPDRAVQAAFDEIFDAACFFGKNQCVDQDCAFRSDNDPGCDLCIHLAGENVDVVCDTLTLHSFIESRPVRTWAI